MKHRIYLESTVFGYLTSRPSSDDLKRLRQLETVRFWSRIERYEAFVSTLVMDEIGDGDSGAARKRIEVASKLEVLPASPEAEILAEGYLNAGIIPARASADAAHIAIATIHRMDSLVSWNFRHIVRGDVVERIVRYNRLRGFETPFICTPESLSRD